MDQLDEIGVIVRTSQNRLKLWIFPESFAGWTVVLEELNFPSWRKTSLDLTEALEQALNELSERDEDDSVFRDARR
jgi:hypothetical protein